MVRTACVRLVPVACSLGKSFVSSLPLTNAGCRTCDHFQHLWPRPSPLTANQVLVPSRSAGPNRAKQLKIGTQCTHDWTAFHGRDWDSKGCASTQRRLTPTCLSRQRASKYGCRSRLFLQGIKMTFFYLREAHFLCLRHAGGSGMRPLNGLYTKQE